MAMGVFSVNVTPEIRCGEVVKSPVQLISTMKASSLRSVGEPVMVLVTARVSVSRSFSNAASMLPVESVVMVTVVPLVFVQPAGGASSVTVHSLPGAKSGVSGAAHEPVWPSVVMLSVPEKRTSPVALVHSTSNSNVSSRMTGTVSGPMVVLVIEKVDVVLTMSMTSPSVSIVTESLTELVKRGSLSSTAEHSAPVGRSSITSGVLSVTIWSAMMWGSVVRPPPVQVTVTVNGSFERSTPVGTPSSVLLIVSDPASRSLVNSAVWRSV